LSWWRIKHIDIHVVNLKDGGSSTYHILRDDAHIGRILVANPYSGKQKKNHGTGGDGWEIDAYDPAREEKDTKVASWFLPVYSKIVATNKLTKVIEGFNIVTPQSLVWEYTNIRRASPKASDAELLACMKTNGWTYDAAKLV